VNIHYYKIKIKKWKEKHKELSKRGNFKGASYALAKKEYYLKQLRKYRGVEK